MTSSEYIFIGRGVKWRDHYRVNSPIVSLNWDVGLEVLEIFGSPEADGVPSPVPFRDLKIKAIMKDYRPTPLGIYRFGGIYVPDRWDWKLWLSNIVNGRWPDGLDPRQDMAWVWKLSRLISHPPLETAAAAGRLAQALESHDPGIEPLWLEILRYDPNAHVTSDPDDEPYTPRDHFVWMFRQVEYICKELAGLGADVVTFVELKY